MLFAFTAFVLWRPIQHQLTAQLLLWSESPSEEVLSELTEEVREPAAFLVRLWQTQKLPHRQFVAGYLNRASAASPGLIASLEPILLQGPLDPDIEVRRAALAALHRIKHPQLRRLLLHQLSDADPAVRLIGLEGLHAIATSNDVPVIIEFLKDPEPRVVVAAALLLHGITGHDSGIKLLHATPQFSCVGTDPPPAADIGAIQQGVQRWHEWWTRHQREYQTPSAPASPLTNFISLPTPDFTLKDSVGTNVSLAQFRGKTVLLALWSPDAPTSLNDMPALEALCRRHPEHLAILGICLPPAPTCADEHDHHHAQTHEHADHHSDPNVDGTPRLKTTDPFRALAQQAAQRLKVSFPMLIDSAGITGARFKVEDRPTYVLINSRGAVRRRFVGFRTESAFEAILAADEAPGLPH